MKEVYHLNYHMERKILDFLDNEFEGYTKNDLINEVELCLNDRVHLASSDELLREDDLHKLAIKELTDPYRGPITTAFYDVTLPDIKVVQQQQHQQEESKSVEEKEEKEQHQQQESKSVEEKEHTLTPKIYVSKDADHPICWEWNFRVLDSHTNCNYNCILHCTGKIYVEHESLSELLDSHAIRYKMKSNILGYGICCYTDCYGDNEMEGAEEHCKSELEYNDSCVKVVGYDLTDVGEINNKAEDEVKKLLDEDMGNVDFDFQECKPGEEPTKPHDDKPVVIRTVDKKGYYKWVWNFYAIENDYGCEMKYKGVIGIISKKSRNPKIPNEKKRKRPFRSAWKAAPRPKEMLTKIVGL